VRVCHFDPDRSATVRIREAAAGGAPTVAVERTEGVDAAVDVVATGRVDCLVTDRLDDSDWDRLVDAAAGADAPVVCYAGAAHAGVDSDRLAAVDSLVEKGTGTAPAAFLVEEALALVGVDAEIRSQGAADSRSDGNADAQIFVPDAATGRVHVYTSVGIADGVVPEDGEVKLPRGVAVDPQDGAVARVWVADSANGRVGAWEYDRVLDGAEPLGDRGVYVADGNNNRLQRFDGDEWHPVGEPGYGGGREFLLLISVAAREGNLFVLDLVSRSVRVFTEDGSAEGGLRPVDEYRAFGGDAAAGELWLPYLLSAGDGSDVSGHDIVVPDSTLHVAHRFTWSGE
jgi:hypothetical protein